MKRYSIKELVKKIKNKEISCVEVVTYYLNQIKEKENKIDAFLYLDEEAALKRAKEIGVKAGIKYIYLNFFIPTLNSLTSNVFGFIFTICRSSFSL